jgi:hypothetical protein
MLPRQVRGIGEVERAVIHERYMEIGPIWDMIANDTIVRHERFRDIFLPMCRSSMLMLEIDVQQEEDFAILLQENKGSKYRTCTI